MKLSQNQKRNNKKILLIGEHVTNSHILRPLSLAMHLKSHFQVLFACDQKASNPILKNEINHIPISSINPQHFLKRLYWGQPAYTKKEIHQYYKDDLNLIQKTAPDLVISDFRVTTNTACEVSNVPHIQLCNFQWSPFAKLNLPMPDHPLNQLLGYQCMHFF